MSEIDPIEGEIARAQARLAELDREREATRARLDELRAAVGRSGERTSVDGNPSHAAPPVRPATFPGNAMTPGEKVALFGRLFRGRPDVYARLWLNARKGTKGYAPACTNEWVRGVCDKPRVKCGDCPDQAFLPADDRAILDHLQGRHVMGLYPMLTDETCWLLAVDFDRDSWADDVSAFVATAREHGLEPAVERSRSGNGAHVWFFFSEPIAAATARRMGSFLITEAMSRRHELGLHSYDRLFPNQDTLPRGGFGNLIALPLQRGPRTNGNTVFIDDRLNPYVDQWAYLSSLRRLPSETVERLANNAVRSDRVADVHISQSGEEAGTPPWEIPPSGRTTNRRIQGPLPPAVRAVLSQRVFVEKAGLPSALLSEIKRIAAFQNPEFYKKQSLRLSTALTPRLIGCAEEHSEHLALPRGCLDDLRDILTAHGIALDIEDRRNAAEPLGLVFRGELTASQGRAVNAITEHDAGILVAPPGAGKTVMGAHLAATRDCSTLVLVHRKPLLDQWVAQISVFLGLDSGMIGTISSGRRRPTGRIDVAMIQSLCRKREIDDLVAEYGHVIVDECHHVPAVSFEQVLAAARPRFVTGLTATPYRRDGRQPIILMQCGPVRYTIDAKSHSLRHAVAHRLICRESAFLPANAEECPPIQALYAALATDGERNRMIAEDVARALDEGRSPLVLTERKDHLEILADILRHLAPNVVVLHGGRTTRVQRETRDRIASIPDSEKRLVLATGRYIGEGFDDSRLDTLFLTMPVSWKGTIVQYAGRLLRRHPEKTEVRIYDYADRRVPMFERMFAKRLRGYRALGYALDPDLSRHPSSTEAGRRFLTE